MGVNSQYVRSDGPDGYFIVARARYCILLKLGCNNVVPNRVAVRLKRLFEFEHDKGKQTLTWLHRLPTSWAVLTFYSSESTRIFHTIIFARQSSILWPTTLFRSMGSFLMKCEHAVLGRNLVVENHSRVFRLQEMPA